MARIWPTFRETWRSNALVRWGVALALIVALSALFAELAEDVWAQESFVWDAQVIYTVHSVHAPWLDTTMRAVTRLGFSVALIVAAAMVAGFLWQRRRLDATTVAVCLTGGIVLNSVLKLIFARPRPALFTPLVEQGGFSFPSGHVATSVTVYGLLAIYLWRSGHHGWALLAAVIVPLVAFSRIYLGVHYPSDTLASMAWATLWLWAVIAIRDRQAVRVYVNSDDASTREKAARVL